VEWRKLLTEAAAIGYCTDMAIVTSTYRYKRPPRKRKAVPLAGPAIVRRDTPKPETPPAPANDDRKSAETSFPGGARSAIVTARRPGSRSSVDVPDMTPEEHRRRGDAADTHPGMSRGSGRVERRAGELFTATKDRALSVGELASYAFELTDGAVPNRKQRLSATRAAHRLLRRAAALTEAAEATFDRVIAATTATLGRPPGGRGRPRDRIFSVGSRLVAMDEAFHDAVQSAPGWPAYQQAFKAWRREYDRLDGVLLSWNRGWRVTETKDGRLWFHPADYPVRVWAVAIQPQGAVWADAEIVGVDNTYVRVRYDGEPARLDRARLARSWTIYRNVYFTSSRSGYAARAFDQMWRERYWHPGSAPPPAMQVALDDAIKLLGVPADFCREDIISAFRRKALQCHPDHGGTEAQFIELVKARDRLLASIGTRAETPKMPEFAPKGVKLRYGTWRSSNPQPRVGQTRRLSVISG
jgi:hypothetical protein